MLGKTTRYLTYALSTAYAVIGAALFFAPEAQAPIFLWSVTGFMTMTIGGWCLGNAFLGFFAARNWQWKSVYPAMAYLWSFGILESVVMISFRDKLNFGYPVAGAYAAAVVLNALSAIFGVADWLRVRPGSEKSEPMTSWMRALAVTTVLFVGFLAIYGLTAQKGMTATNGEVVPEALTVLTMRSVGSFFLALTIGMLPLLFEKNRGPFLSYGFLTLGLTVMVTLAAFVYFPQFNFGENPLGMFYIAAWVVSIALTLSLLRKYGTGLSRA